MEPNMTPGAAILDVLNNVLPVFAGLLEAEAAFIEAHPEAAAARYRLMADAFAGRKPAATTAKKGR